MPLVSAMARSALFPRTAASGESSRDDADARYAENLRCFVGTGLVRFDPQLSPTSVPTPSTNTSGFSSAAQSAASNIQSQRRRIRHVQTFDLARQVDARKVIAGCSRELTQTFSLSAENQRQWCA